MTTLICVPSPGTPKQTVRVEYALWEAYGRVCDADGTNRAKDLREHMERRVKAREGRLPGEPDTVAPEQPQA